MLGWVKKNPWVQKETRGAGRLPCPTVFKSGFFPTRVGCNSSLNSVEMSRVPCSPNLKHIHRSNLKGEFIPDHLFVKLPKVDVSPVSCQGRSTFIGLVLVFCKGRVAAHDDKL